MVECIECGANIETADDIEENEILTCPDCAADLKVASVDPVTLVLAPEEEEDWGQ